MPLYLCRWPNGDVSVLMARNKTDAIIQLDEFDNADYAEISRLSEFLVDFRLDDEGRLELAGLGEGTENTIMGTAFPDLEATLTSEELLTLKPESPQYRLRSCRQGRIYLRDLIQLQPYQRKAKPATRIE